jgi:hypothetical protein
VMRAPAPIYVIRLRGRRPDTDIHALRRFLKILSRHCGLQCIDARKETHAKKNNPPPASRGALGGRTEDTTL